MFLKLNNANVALALLNKEGRYYSSYDNYVSVNCIESDVRNKAKKYTPYYLRAKREYEEFKKRHQRIFAKEEELQDSDCSIRLSWILCGISRVEALEKHMARYQDIYQQLKRLGNTVAQYADYAPENIQKTVERAVRSARVAAANRQSARQESQEKRRKALLRELDTAQGYVFLIKQLRIENDNGICTVSGLRDAIKASNEFTPFNQTLINKAITLTR